MGRAGSGICWGLVEGRDGTEGGGSPGGPGVGIRGGGGEEEEMVMNSLLEQPSKRGHKRNESQEGVVWEECDQLLDKPVNGPGML